MSSFSLVISPRDRSRARFIERLMSALPPMSTRLEGSKEEMKSLYHTTLCYHALMCILGFGSWLEPRYIFAAGRLT